MLKSVFRFVAILTLGLVPALFAAAPLPLAPDPSSVAIVRRFARQFPEDHLRHLPIDSALSTRAWTNYITAFDPERVYFLDSDIVRFRADETKLGTQLKAGDIDFAYEVFAVFTERLRNRYDYVCSLLDKGFDLEKKETYRWKRKDAAWPADEAEWNDLWRKKIKNEYIQQVVARELAVAAATNTVAATNVVEKKEGEPKEKSALPTPEELIKQRYKQLLIVLDDSDAEWVLQRYLTAFTQAYDPHSAYMSLSSMEDFDIEMKLSLIGIGALLNAEDGAAKVVRLIPGGPADMDKRELRLRPNDKIVAVGEGDRPPVDVLHWPLNKIVRLIRGERGTKVVLTVVPASDPTGSTTKTVDLIRDEVKLEEQAASARYETIKRGDGTSLNLGIITLPTFYANMKVGSVRDDDFKSSAYDVDKILKEMTGKNVDGVILDLRNNGGGSLMEAIKLTGLFITLGPTVQVKDRSLKVWPDLDPNISYSGPLLVLVNRLSASASEIVAGALQDYGRAVIVGDTKTHGKGTVQTILDLNQRNKKMGAVKVTTGSYYRISGTSTQLKGVTPDIVIHSPFDYMELGEEYLPNALDLSDVTSATYTPVADLAPLIPTLRTNSETRCANDPRFIAYGKLLQRIETINKTEELPLNLDERRALAKSEKELSTLEAELDPDTDTENTPETPKKDIKHDLVLQESLNVLADFVQLTRPSVAPPAQPVVQPTSGMKETVKRAAAVVPARIGIPVVLLALAIVLWFATRMRKSQVS